MSRWAPELPALLRWFERDDLRVTSVLLPIVLSFQSLRNDGLQEQNDDAGENDALFQAQTGNLGVPYGRHIAFSSLILRKQLHEAA